jgi:hypothetical protein
MIFGPPMIRRSTDSSTTAAKLTGASREDEGILAHTSLERVVSWWAPWEGADLVVVAT